RPGRRRRYRQPPGQRDELRRRRPRHGHRRPAAIALAGQPGRGLRPPRMKATTARGASHGLLDGAIAAIVVLAAGLGAGALGGGLPAGAVLLVAVATASAAVGALFLYPRRRGRPPGRLRTRPSLTWSDRPFLGWTAGGGSFIVGTPEDTVGIVGPPRVGKTAGLLVAQAHLWGGPLVSTSTKADVLRATAARRLVLAAAGGGSGEVYYPTSTDPVEGL